MDATTSSAQTLTCNIGDVTEAVDVSWKDSADLAITADTSGYTITKGSVNEGTMIQESILTIDPSKLAGLDTSSPLTWKCAAKSTAYPDSEISTFSPLVVTFLDYGKFLESVHLK